MRVLSSRALRIMERSAIVVLAALCVFFVVQPNDTFFDFWSDRDMLRSVELFKQFQWSGAELSYGTAARVPGGFLHYIWVIPTIFSKNPVLSYQFCMLISVLALIPFYNTLRRNFGAIAAIAASVVLLCSPIFFSNATRLWNPGFQVPFVILSFAFLTSFLFEGRDRHFKWVIACIVLAMQMHFSVFLMFVPLAAALALMWRWPSLKEFGLAVLVGVLLLATYFIGDALHGFVNTKGLLFSQGQSTIRDVGSVLALNLENAPDFFRWLSVDFPRFQGAPASWDEKIPLMLAANFLVMLAGVYVLFAAAYWLEWGKGIVRRLELPVAGVYGRMTTVCLCFIATGFIYLVYSPHIELYRYGAGRYIMFVLPAFAILAGLGAGALHAMAARRKRLEIAALAVLGAAALLQISVTVRSWHALDGGAEVKSGRSFIAALDIAEKVTGWPREDILTKTTMLREHQPHDDSWTVTTVFPTSYEMYRLGMNMLFAGKSPCLAIAPGGDEIYAGKPMTAGALKRSFAQPRTDIKILRQEAVPGFLFVIYERAQGHCFSTMMNRYVPTPEEALTEKIYGQLAAGEVVKAKKGEGAGFIVNLDNVIYALIRLQNTDGKLVAELHSNQLRGESYNGGFLASGMVENPRLEFAGAKGRRTIVFDPGLVGMHGVLTPIRQNLNIPDGEYSLTLKADLFTGIVSQVWPVDLNGKKPVAVALPGRVKVQKGQISHAAD